MTAFLAACGGSGNGAAGGDVNVTEFIWVGSGQGVTPREVRKTYLEAHPNVSIDFVEGTNAETYPKILASLQITPDDPLVNFGFFNSDAMTKGTLADIWLPLSPERVPNIEGVLPDFRLPGDKGVYFASSPVGIMYSAEVFEQKGWAPPSSWNDLWDPKYKGKVAVWDAPAWSFNGLAVTARVNGGGEENIEPGMAIYEKAAKAGQIHSLYTSNSQAQQLLVSGDAWITPFFFGIMQPWVEDGAPLGYAVPKEGQIAFPLGFAMVKGSSPAQQQVATDVIDMMLAPEVVSRWSNLTFSVPVVRDAKVNPSLAKLPAYQPAAISNQIALDWETIADKNDEWLQAWDRRVKGNL